MINRKKKFVRQGAGNQSCNKSYDETTSVRRIKLTCLSSIYTMPCRYGSIWSPIIAQKIFDHWSQRIWSFPPCRKYLFRLCIYGCTVLYYNSSEASLLEQRAFRLIANNQFPTNPLIIMFELRYGEIFKVRNPIRNCRDKWVDILDRAAFRKFERKDSEVNKGGEKVYDMFVNAQHSLWQLTSSGFYLLDRQL